MRFCPPGTTALKIWCNSGRFRLFYLYSSSCFSVLFRFKVRRWDAVFLCIFRDQASGSLLWSPQLNLQPSCFRNSLEDFYRLRWLLETLPGEKSRGGGTLLSFIRGCIEIVQCDRTLLDRERRGCRRRLLLLDYCTFTFSKREAVRLHGW